MSSRLSVRSILSELSWTAVTSFGYFENPQEDRQVAMNISHSLKPRGVLVMEMMGKEVLARIFQERDWHEEDGVLILEERKIRSGWDWIDARWILFQDGKIGRAHV